MKMPQIARNQRIVLVHADGMHQIVGHSDQFEGQIPLAITPQRLISEVLEGKLMPEAFQLIKSNPRYLVFQEMDMTKQKGGGSFDRSQR